MARTAEQNRAMRDQSRERILAAAQRLFAQRGYAVATVREIAASAGLSQGLLYTHYLSKEELLRALFRRGMDDVRASFAAAAASPAPDHPPTRKKSSTPADSPARAMPASGGKHPTGNSHVSPLESLVRSALDILRRNIDFWRMSYGLRMQAGVAEALGPDLASWTREILATLEGHFRSAGSRRPAIDAALFFAAFDGLCQHYVLDPRHYPLEELASSLIERFERFDRFTVPQPQGGSHGRSRADTRTRRR
jgi:AcrR family transcriptional regulator